MKLVLTGGPSGGKTTLAQAIQKEFNSKTILVPEAASILWGGGWPRRKNQVGVQHQQRAIYGIQKELESLFVAENPGRLLICDRGSLDGLAYWPGPGPSTEFFEQLETSIEDEIARYDWVLHLDTAPSGHYDLSNPLRNESYEEACKLNDLIKQVWSPHPQRIVIQNDKDGHFIAKLEKALLVIRLVLEGKTYQEIQLSLGTCK